MSDKKLHICIDRDQCIGDGMCVNEAPETFDLDDEMKAFVLENPGDELQYVIDAARACPLDIIIVKDAATGEQLYPEK